MRTPFLTFPTTKTLKPNTRFTRVPALYKMSSGQPSETAQVQARSNQIAASGSPTEGDLNIQTTPNVGPGVQLSEQQKLVAGSVLDVSFHAFVYGLTGK